MDNMWLKGSLWGASVLALTGCSVLLDAEKKQCKKDDDCSKPYVCGGAGICEQQTGCEVDADCREGGICVDKTCTAAACDSTDDCGDDGKLCNTATKRCIALADATCEASPDCAAYDGAPQWCDKSSGKCSEPECAKDEDCKGDSPTAVCNEGACEDPIWGCLGVEDPRPEQNMSAPSTFKVKVLYAYAQGGAKETGVENLKVTVCNFPDTECQNSRRPDKDIKYVDNMLIVENLDPGVSYRIKLKATHPADDKEGLPLLDGEFLMYRTPVGETVEPKPILMFEEAVRDDLARLADVNIDPTLGMMLMRVFDCTETEVAGVVVDARPPTTGCDGGCPTTVFYQNTFNLPDPNATETNLAGRAGIINLQTTAYNRVTLTRSKDNEIITSYLVTARANTITYVHFYPWDYGTSVD